MPLETTVFDPVEFLDTPEAQTELLDDALASGNAAYVAHALGVVARARGMADVAREAGLSRESLYKALSDNGNPALATVLKVTKALGIRLTAQTERSTSPTPAI